MWISTGRAMELLGVKRAQFFNKLKNSTIERRNVTAAGRGRPRIEVKLESLPAEIQKRFYDCPPPGSRMADEDGGESRRLAASALIKLANGITAIEECGYPHGMRLAKVVIEGRRTWLAFDCALPRRSGRRKQS
jgi:hypothetical protein